MLRQRHMRPVQLSIGKLDAIERDEKDDQITILDDHGIQKATGLQDTRFCKILVEVCGL